MCSQFQYAVPVSLPIMMMVFKKKKLIYIYIFFFFFLSLATAHARKSLPCELSVCYDQESGQTLDIYYPKSAKTGTTFY